MKVFALAILLVSVCCLEGAVVRRQAEERQAPISEQVYQQVSEAVNRYVSSGLLSQERMAQLKTQAQEHLQQFHEHIGPLAEQMKERMSQWFTELTESVKKLAQQGAASA